MGVCNKPTLAHCVEKADQKYFEFSKGNQWGRRNRTGRGRGIIKKDKGRIFKKMPIELEDSIKWITVLSRTIHQ
jgi:hypothetical protein